MKVDSDDVQREACWALCNMTSGGRPEHMRYLIEQNAAVTLCDLLSAQDSRTIEVALEGIENLLRDGARCLLVNDIAPEGHAGPPKSACVIAIEACGGVEKLSLLCRPAGGQDARERALRMLRLYFPEK